MKRKDLTLIVMIAVVSGVFSLILSNLIIGTPKKLQATVEVVDEITAEFSQPDGRYFNAQSYNPTQLIQIKGNENPKPLN